MTASRLAVLLDQATRERPGLGPPTREETLARFFVSDNAVDMARLLIDMAAWIDGMGGMGGMDEGAALLARFAALDEKAGGAS